MHIRSFVWILLPLMTIGACNRADKTSRDKATTKQAPLTNFQEAAQLGELYPLSNGGAYFPSLKGVFYISDGEAVSVKGLPTGNFFQEIHPLSDGSAILNDRFSSPPTLYLLRQDVATPILEKTQLSSKNVKTPTSIAFYFLESQRLERKLKESKEEVEEARASSDESDYNVYQDR